MKIAIFNNDAKNSQMITQSLVASLEKNGLTIDNQQIGRAHV